MYRVVPAALMLLFAVLAGPGAADCAAQSDPNVAVLSAAVSGVESALRTSRYARIAGPLAFDARIVQTSQVTAPTTWPDSLVLSWAGDVRDSTFAPNDVQLLLRDVNLSRKDAPHWVQCGDSQGLPACDRRRFSLLFAASRPVIRGDVAQVLVFVRHWTRDTEEHSAWYASVARLERVNNQWVVTRWLNRASS